MNTTMAPDIGKKAINLLELSKRYPTLVPSFVIVRVDQMFTNWSGVSSRLNLLVDEFLTEKISLSLCREQLDRLLSSLAVNQEFLTKLADELKEQAFSRASYRTSASLEDLADHSFAGQYLTLVNQTTDQLTISGNLSQCVSSMFSDRVLIYAKAVSMTKFNQGGSVVIQKMFYGNVSGVLFTENSNNQAVISYRASWENKIVEGDNSIDCLVDKNTFEIVAGQIPHQNSHIFRKLTRLAVDLEQQLGYPLDIEWSATSSSLALLQFRPITKFQTEYAIEWDNTNIAESYPGITLPLTYSFIRPLYASVYPEFLKLMKFSDKFLTEHRFIFDNLLGYINGRVYYNINNWYELVKLIPGYAYNKEFFEAMLVPAKKNLATKTDNQPKTLAGRLAYYLMMGRFVVLMLRADSFAKNFIPSFLVKYKRYNRISWEALSAPAVLQIFSEIRRDLLQQWAIPILNDFRTMVFHGLLRRLSSNNNNADFVKILGGIYDQVSAEPIRKLSILVKEVKHAMQSEPDLTISDWPSLITSDERFSGLKKNIKHYIDVYGGRSPDELKLENPRIGEDFIGFTAFLVNSAKTYSERNLVAPNPMSEGQLLNQLLSTSTKSNQWWLKPLCRFVLNKTKQGISQRERFRLYRAQAFGIARKVYLALGNRLVDSKLLDVKEDIFWLTESEIEEIVLGHTVDWDVKVKVVNRKAVFDKYQKIQSARRLLSVGVVAPQTNVADLVADGSLQTNHLTGIGVSAGLAQGEALVMGRFDPQADVNGKILVVEHTDPGWTILFLNVKAVVVERGNLLSHASIVARELGIPAVVAIEDACSKIRSGQTISVDGNRGEVVII